MTSTTQVNEYADCKSYMNDPQNKHKTMIAVNGIVHRPGCPCLREKQLETFECVFMDRCDELGTDSNWLCHLDTETKTLDIISRAFTTHELHEIISGLLSDHYKNAGYTSISVTESPVTEEYIIDNLPEEYYSFGLKNQHIVTFE